MGLTEEEYERIRDSLPVLPSDTADQERPGRRKRTLVKNRISHIALGSREADSLVRCLVLCLAAAVSLPAQTFTNLFYFNNSDGAGPSALVQGANGNLYGTTGGGGPSNFGTIFKITPGGVLTTLYDFCLQSNCPDGEYPAGPLVQGPDGDLYGLTTEGGSGGDGTIFKITPAGAFTSLHTFDGTDGLPSAGALVLALNGTLYGTATKGGANGDGTIFEITSNGSFTLLHSFDGTDGSNPSSPLVQANNGDLYGTTEGGGADNSGTVFKITPRGVFTTLYSFCSQTACADGAGPMAGLILGTDGDLYGTTYNGGADGPGGLGAIFKITPGGAMTTLFEFNGFNNPNGGNPAASLVQANDGNFYGSTVGGGLYSEGTIFRMSPTGNLTTVYNFCVPGFPGTLCTDGANPRAALIQDTNGQFYGSAGPPYSFGGIFSFSENLTPFVKTEPGNGFPGAIVRILGTDLKGATSVTFDGASAVFAVISASQILAQVPVGAKTGTVQVVTPGGTLLSNAPFRVL